MLQHPSQSYKLPIHQVARRGHVAYNLHTQNHAKRDGFVLAFYILHSKRFQTVRSQRRCRFADYLPTRYAQQYVHHIVERTHKHICTTYTSSSNSNNQQHSHSCARALSFVSRDKRGIADDHQVIAYTYTRRHTHTRSTCTGDLLARKTQVTRR